MQEPVDEVLLDETRICVASFRLHFGFGTYDGDSSEEEEPTVPGQKLNLIPYKMDFSDLNLEHVAVEEAKPLRLWDKMDRIGHSTVLVGLVYKPYVWCCLLLCGVSAVLCNVHAPTLLPTAVFSSLLSVSSGLLSTIAATDLPSNLFAHNSAPIGVSCFIVTLVSIALSVWLYLDRNPRDLPPLIHDDPPEQTNKNTVECQAPTSFGEVQRRAGPTGRVIDFDKHRHELPIRDRPPKGYP